MSDVTLVPKDAPRLGEYARSDRGYEGRVYAISHGCEENTDWQKANHITKSELKEMWLHVLVFPGGAVTGPVSRFTKIDPIPNFHEQRDAADYFADCVTDETKYFDPSRTSV